ncbi:MAG: SRPBCC family protein, partial [Myxococcales bacterium]
MVDRIPLGPLRLRTSYVAALDPVSESEIHGYAWQFPAVRLVTVYALHEIEGGTQLVER